MYIGEIIKQYRVEHKLSQRAFAKKTTLSPSYINTLEKIYNPKTKKPYSVTTDVAIEFANAMNISIEELLLKINENQEFTVNTSFRPIPLSELQLTKIPVLGAVKAGYNYLADENKVGYIHLEYSPSDPENYYALEVTGDSMEPLFSDGDIAIVHKQDNFDSGNTCIVLINGDEATVKKVVRMEDGIDLIAMNPYYPIRHFTKEEMNKIPVQIIGRVIEARKRKQFE